MSPTIADKNSCNYRALLFLATYSAATALLLLSPRSDAYEWELTPIFRTDLIFTDNLRLVPDNSPVKKEAEFITRIMPGFHSRFTSRRFDSAISFRIRNIIFANNSDRNRTLINLRTQNTGEIIKNLFYVDANARIHQRNQSILAPQGDDANISGNLKSLRMYSVSPYIRKRFSNFATTEIRYARILIDSDTSNVFFSSNSNVYQFSLISGTNFRTLEWGLNYFREDIDFDFRPKTVKLETEIANIQYNFTRNFGLTGTGGYEENTLGGGFDKPKGIRWSAGFIWFPTPRTSLEASAGQRFFGDNYAYNVTHRMRYMALHSSYKELVRSIRNELLLDGAGDTLTLLTALLTSQASPGTSPAEIALAAQQLISNLGLPPNQFFGQELLTNRFFLEKRFTASVGILTNKNTLLFRVFQINRTPLAVTTTLLDATVGGSQQANLKQKGVNATWSWRVSPRTRVNLVLLYTKLHFPTLFRRDELKMVSFGVSRQFRENIVGLLRYRRWERTSNLPLADFTENRFMASLRIRF